jgi:transposase
MRPRKLSLHKKTVEKLKRLRKEAERDGAYRVATRLHAVLLNSDGMTSGEIVSLLNAPRSRISEWLRNYAEHGYEGLLEGHRSGGPCKMSKQQKLELCDIIDSGPIAYGYCSGVWTSPMIVRVIEEEFNVTYHPGHVRKMLHDLGFSVQRPTRKLAKADPTEQDRWQRYTYPNLKKKRVHAMRR